MSKKETVHVMSGYDEFDDVTVEDVINRLQQFAKGSKFSVGEDYCDCCRERTGWRLLVIEPATEIDILEKQKKKKKPISTKNGSPFDRGGADSYYGRAYDPHWYPNGTGKGDRIGGDEMTTEQIGEYHAGFKENEESRCFND